MRLLNPAESRHDPSVLQLLALAAGPESSPAAAQRLAGLLDGRPGVQLLADFDASGKLAALALWRGQDRYAVVLEALAVLPAARGRGVGTQLVHQVREHSERSVVALATTETAGFWHAAGFLVSGASSNPCLPGRQQICATLPHAALLAQPGPEADFEYVDGCDTPGLVQITEPQESWPADFARLDAALRQALGGTALAVEHAGSTSVPGLPAKPVIDIVLLVADPDDEAAYAPALRQAGFDFWLREPGWYRHRLFKPQAATGLPQSNIHVFAPGSPEYLRMMLYRDHLRTHAADRQSYAQVKRAAAAQLAAARGTAGLVMEYNKIKEPFILSLHRRIFGQ